MAIEFGRIVGHRKEHPQQGAIGDLAGIEFDLHRFRMAGRAGADQFIARVFDGSAGIAGENLPYAFDMLENALHAPKAAAGEHRGFLAAWRRGRGIDRGRRRQNGRFLRLPN